MGFARSTLAFGFLSVSACGGGSGGRGDAAGLTIWPGRRDAEVRCIAGGRATPATSTTPGEYVCARGPDPTAYVRAEIIEPQGRRAWAQPCWSH